MTVITDPDGQLALSRRRFDDAVHCLCDPLPQWFNGSCRWQPALYTRLRTALAGQVVRGSGARRSAPGRVEVLAWLLDVDATVTTWTPEAKEGTVERLYALLGHGWRPQDCSLIERHCETSRAGRSPGPSCSTARRWCTCTCRARPVARKWAYRHDDSDERVRSRALRVSEDGCTCGACQAFWAPAEFHWLARLIGCKPLPA